MANNLDPVEGLMQFVADIKPYHTKIIDVVIEYVYSDKLHIAMKEEFNIAVHVDFDRSLGYCPDGFGLVPLGLLTDEQMPINFQYNINSISYRDYLDISTAAYDNTATGTSDEINASSPYINFDLGITESNWDNSNCPVSQEGLIFPTFFEDFTHEIQIENRYQNNFHLSYDALGLFTFDSSNDTPPIPATTVTAKPRATNGPFPLVSVAKAHVHLYENAWYWEFIVENVGIDTRLGAMEFNPTLVEPPYDITNNESHLGDLPLHFGLASNGTLYIAGTSINTGLTFTSGDTIGIAFSVETGEMSFIKGTSVVGPYAMDIGNGTGVFSPAISTKTAEEAKLTISPTSIIPNGLGITGLTLLETYVP